MNKILIFLVTLLLNTSVFAATSPIVEKLNLEEAKWHKGFVFSTAGDAKTPAELIDVLNWLRSRAESPDMPDARYAVFYSFMLRRTNDPGAIDTINLFAIIGYFSLQIDSARCANRNESIMIARQWYDAVRPQLQGLKNVSLQMRQRYLMLSRGYLLTYMAKTDPKELQSSAWMCYHLPSYLNKIRNLPDTVMDATQVNNNKLIVYISNPTIMPELADPTLFNTRSESIMKDLEKMVMKDS